MTARLFCLLAIIAAAAMPTARAAEQIMRRTFPVRPGCRLKVDAYRGDVDVSGGDAREITVEVRLSVLTDDASKAARAFASVHLEASSRGNEVAVVARDPLQTGIRFDWEDDERVDLSFKIVVPRACDADLSITHGNLTVGDLRGAMSARVKRGTIYFKRIAGSVRAEMDEGSIIVSHCAGRVALKTRSGSIQAGTVGGGSVLRTGDGDIEVQHAPGGVSASAEAGGITVGFPAGLSGDSRLVTNGGGIYIKIDPGAACTVHAVSSAFGDVRSTLPLAIKEGGNGKSRLDGTLNGGGPVIAIDASGGHVKIDPSDPSGRQAGFP